MACSGLEPSAGGLSGVNNDGEVIAESAAVSDVEAPHPTLHYVFLPSRKAATFVGKDLHGRGFTTEERLGADGANWLVLARHVAVPAEAAVAAIRRSMEALVAQLGGEYDGWEADVPRHEPAAH